MQRGCVPWSFLGSAGAGVAGVSVASGARRGRLRDALDAAEVLGSAGPGVVSVGVAGVAR